MLEEGEDIDGVALIAVCGTCKLVHYSPVGKAGSPQHSNCQGKDRHKTSYVRKPGCQCIPSDAVPSMCETCCSCDGG